LEVGGLAATLVEGLDRGVDRDKEDIVFANLACYARGEKKVSAASGLDDLEQPRFKDRQIVGLPGGDARLFDLANRYPALGALTGDHSHRRPPTYPAPMQAILFIRQFLPFISPASYRLLQGNNRTRGDSSRRSLPTCSDCSEALALSPVTDTL
jgi:hypothetical protein